MIGQQRHGYYGKRCLKEKVRGEQASVKARLREGTQMESSEHRVSKWNGLDSVGPLRL